MRALMRDEAGQLRDLIGPPVPIAAAEAGPRALVFERLVRRGCAVSLGIDEDGDPRGYEITPLGRLALWVSVAVSSLPP